MGVSGAESTKLDVDAEYRHPTASVAMIMYFFDAGRVSMPISIGLFSRMKTIVVPAGRTKLPHLRRTVSTPTKKFVS